LRHSVYAVDYVRVCVVSEYQIENAETRTRLRVDLTRRHGEFLSSFVAGHDTVQRMAHFNMDW